MPTKEAVLPSLERTMGNISETWIAALCQSRQLSLKDLEYKTEAAIAASTETADQYLQQKLLELKLRKTHTQELSAGL